jgi:hypothetical protein
MGLFDKRVMSDEDMSSAQFKGEDKKFYKKKKKAMKAQGMNNRTAKRMAKEDQEDTTIAYGYGGKVKYKKGGMLGSKNKTKHRGKTTNGGYGNGM